MAIESTVATARLKRFPKVDLHRHLEGSLRIATILELARSGELDLPPDEPALRALVQVQPDDPRTSSNFLSKFQALRRLFHSPAVIRRVVREAVVDAASDNVRYLELRFTPVALSQAGRFPLSEVMEWVAESAMRAAQEQGIGLALIASVNRHESVESAEEVAQFAADAQHRGIVGLDLAGNEADFPAEPFHSIFLDARSAGLGLTVHAGEWAGAESVRHAISRLGAARIGHGVRVLEDEDTVRLARENRAVFEVCPSSNLQSGVVTRMSEHALPHMIEAGLRVTLNSDDPGVSGITLSSELALAQQEFGLSLESLKGLTLTAAQASFLTAKSKRDLELDLQNEFLLLERSGGTWHVD